MRSNRLRTWGLVAVVVGATGPNAKSADRDELVVKRTSVRLLKNLATDSVVASSPSSVSAIALPRAIDASEVRPLSGVGGVAAPPVGSTQVYRNEVAPLQSYYGPPCPNQRMADDLQLANGGGDLVYYNLGVFGGGPVASTFSVHTELWTGDPCAPTSTAITGTAADFNVTIAVDTQRTFLLERTIPSPGIPIPATVWVAATFSRSDAGWIVAGQAEVGSTNNYFSENDTNSGPPACLPITPHCAQYNFTGPTAPWAGFWANVYANIPAPPNGACCNGTTCAQTTQASCASPSVWQGAFTTCQPNACLTGACCDGADFETCTDTNEPGCPNGLFKPGTSCAANACGPNFEVYENSFATGIFVGIDATRKWADDLTLGAGAPCPMVAYELLMAGDGTPPALPTFNAHVELWTNNDHGTPTVDTDDTPLAVIPGTARDFNNLAADLTRQRLLVGPFTGIQVPPKVWMVVTTNAATAGPIFGGLASVGFSQDGFAVFNDPAAPNTWTPGFRFPPNGFDPTNCPGPNCTPAGSFRARVWCEGSPPTGACCNDVTGTCSDGILSTACEGRWLEAVTCASNPFDPPCGSHGCCYPNPLNPASISCQDLTPQECTSLGGSSAPGRFCVGITCPARACINKPGACFSPHPTGGCQNAFCCDTVCAADPFCCTSDWDATCVDRARTLCSSDQCSDALPISGPGTFPFDNTNATTDGPPHTACRQSSTEDQISKDVWYCWTASCTDNIYVRTCGQTTVDTRLAVYDGCTCPPTDANLLDCNDDACGQGPPVQSVAVFHAAAGRKYLIRLGNFPLAQPGTGSLTIGCGPPNQLHCPATGGCCAGMTTPGCVDEACCEAVCGCDPFCCETEWDATCATTGLGGFGCGAGVLCPALCGGCPSGTVAFNSPPPGILDAARPFPPNDATQLLGIDTIQVTAPAGSNLLGCWKVCETAISGVANGIASITDGGGGQFTIKLARPITAGAVTKITYLGTGSSASYIFHPGNINADGTVNLADVTALVNALNGVVPLPVGLLSGDVDRSGAVTPADILDEIGLLNGEGAYVIWNNTAKPTPNANCP